MGDSDADDYDRRRARDKFRRERSDYQERRGEERGRRAPAVADDYVESRRGDVWNRDRGGGRRDYRAEVDMRRRERYSPPRHDMSPPMKKMRRNWDLDMCPTQPPMMTFKQFLGSQDDCISDEEAVRKYNDYKQEFRRQQLNEFFLTHKEEEWFKSKYQPEECVKRRQEQLAGLNKRVDVYFELLEKKWITDISVDSDKSDAIIRLLDAVVIKLEGGSDSDLKVLDEAAELEKFEKIWTSSSGTVNPEWKKKPEENKEPTIVVGPATEPINESESDWDKDGDEPGSEKSSAKTNVKSEKEDDDKEKPEREKDEEKLKNEVEDTDEKMEDLEEEDKKKSKKKKDKEDKKENEVKKEDAEEAMEEDGAVKDDAPDSKTEAESGEVATEVEKNEEGEVETVVRPRPLHRTCSIFLRNLAPTITKQEVETMCRRFPGFLRVAIADPQPDRRFFRRGWVTFERVVNIKETCWHLNNIRLRDCELGAIVNRDLTRRIRSGPGVTSHKQVVRADIKLAAKIVQKLDKRNSLWTEEKDGDENGQLGFGLISRNPLLKNITDYLIEEADAEEEELLGMSTSDEVKKEGEAAETTVERDETLIKVLDKLLLYLRIVHSVDYYNHSDYPNEDEMPNRCGIMHARGPAPSTKVTQTEINEYINGFEAKISPFLQPLAKLSDEEAVKLGKKDPPTEVEKFIQANTQELGKDKWLCPLSGKKFKGPEFVKKHIFNKHGEKIEEVKKEVEYFNNYLLDPKRPQLLEHPGNRVARGEGAPREGFGHPGGYPHPPPYGFGYGQGSRMPGNHGYSGYGGRGGFGDGYRGGNFYGQKRGGIGRSNFHPRNRGDPREIIGYHDLDAPEDVEVF